MKFPVIIKVPHLDGRGWISIACFTLVLICLALCATRPDLLKDEFFKTIVTALVISAWIGGPVGWAFQATKSGGELAERNADLVKKQAESLPLIADK